MKRYLHRPILSQLAEINNYFSALNKCILSIEIIYMFSYNIYSIHGGKTDLLFYSMYGDYFFIKGYYPEKE